MKLINVENYVNKLVTTSDSKYTRELLISFSKEVLELAAENAEIDTINMGSSEFQTIISKSSIINTINQIE